MPADDAGIAAMQHLSTKLNNSYPSIRTALSPEYRHLSSENIEGLLQQTLGNEVSAEDLEDLLGSLKSIGRSAVQVLPAVLPIAGTVVGTAIGGPVGGALGGIAGQVAGQAVGAAPQRPARRSTQRSTQRPPGNQVSTVGRSAGRVPARIPTSVPARAQGTQATAQLLRSLSNPQVQQALLAMLLGSAGRQSVQIAGEPVPVAAVGNTLGVLLQNAMTEYSQLQGIAETAVPHYLLDEAGEFWWIRQCRKPEPLG
ncbi:MAG: hypothetical protein HC873_15495 [Leptolyngbyaceae cyanobacterium SL_1_1]|nr:hypothetical protein [Leptolyngbyaceae cyanobacterium SL_1_1]